MFDDIRPYYDCEIPAAMQRIVADPGFPPVCGFLFPGEDPSKVAALLTSCRSIADFQMKFMYRAISSVIRNTTRGVTIDGLDRLDPEKRYLFISNHRDIVLDAAIFQVLLTDAGLPTSEITFGANLMQGQFVIDIGKSNKMFRVERPTTVSSGREFLLKSNRLSEYIRYAVTEKHESIWIAQRNGRTKDGNDQTDKGIINMILHSGGEDWVKSLEELNIVPVSISYEWEPCDLLKCIELSERASGQPYVKRPGEDLKSILTGVMQEKGRVHFSVGKPITGQDIDAFGNFPRGSFTQAVASLIDRWVVSSYKLYPNNLIAYDLLTGENSGGYTDRDKEAFVRHLAAFDGDPASGTRRQLLLELYAAPVKNKATLA